MHSFYIPVMGTGFTIDTPLSVARYGISSAISLVDDALIEQMRKYWCEKAGENYEPILADDEDRRARRITSYLNLLHRIIAKQVADLRQSEFIPGSEITQYFEMLPSECEARKLYDQMLLTPVGDEQSLLQSQLRALVRPGSIDVNIMTKLDVSGFRNGQPLPYDHSDAAAALRGYAESDLSSTIVLSAGFNPHLYGYLAEFADFFPNAELQLKKKVCLKVSDYRSALVQGKYLAKRGIWVSEYSIESPLNCGGHAFVNDGHLIGVILEEFHQKRELLVEEVDRVYRKALQSLKNITLTTPQTVTISSQGGVGNHAEHQFLIKRFKLDAIGWGSPFLLVPEVTNVGTATLQKLIAAQEGDVYLSESSPLGVPFWNLRNSSSEIAREQRIAQGLPGSPCSKGYTRFNTEFTAVPICTASRQYQKLKLAQLEASGLPDEQLELMKQNVVTKSCICHELGGGTCEKRGENPQTPVAICPGPNIVNFKKIVSLREMVNHIYGRCSLLANPNRPHLFIRELQLQVAQLLKDLQKLSNGMPNRSQQKLAEVKSNINAGIEYYTLLAKELLKEQQEVFLLALRQIKTELESLSLA